MSNKKPHPVAVVIRDQIYCAGTIQLGFPIECLNVESGLWSSLPMTNGRNNIAQMINHNEELYVLGEGLIEKFDSTSNRWASVRQLIQNIFDCLKISNRSSIKFTNFQIYDSTNVVIPNYIHSNQLMRIDFEPDGGQKEKGFLSKFCVEKKEWIHYGRLAGRYNTLFNKNSFKFVIICLDE